VTAHAYVSGYQKLVQSRDCLAFRLHSRVLKLPGSRDRRPDMADTACAREMQDQNQVMRTMEGILLNLNLALSTSEVFHLLSYVPQSGRPDQTYQVRYHTQCWVLLYSGQHCLNPTQLSQDLTIPVILRSSKTKASFYVLGGKGQGGSLPIGVWWEGEAA
jgi:hypothetical protein